MLKNFKYEFPTQNCETFIIKVLKQLSVWVPSLVGREVVEWVKREAVITTRTKRVPRRETKVYGNVGRRCCYGSIYGDLLHLADEDLRRAGYARREGVQSHPVRYVHPVQGYNPRTAVLT